MRRGIWLCAISPQNHTMQPIEVSGELDRAVVE
jgi:hypothetical protein